MCDYRLGVKTVLRGRETEESPALSERFPVSLDEQKRLEPTDSLSDCSLQQHETLSFPQDPTLKSPRELGHVHVNARDTDRIAVLMEQYWLSLLCCGTFLISSVVMDRSGVGELLS